MSIWVVTLISLRAFGWFHCPLTSWHSPNRCDHTRIVYRYTASSGDCSMDHTRIVYRYVVANARSLGYVHRRERAQGSQSRLLVGAAYEHRRRLMLWRFPHLRRSLARARSGSVMLQSTQYTKRKKHVHMTRLVSACRAEQECQGAYLRFLWQKTPSSKPWLYHLSSSSTGIVIKSKECTPSWSAFHTASADS